MAASDYLNVQEFENISRAAEAGSPDALNCERVAGEIDSRFGNSLEVGNYAGPEAGGERYGHNWNVGKRGEVIDATANQFGGERVRVIPHWDARQQWYQNDTGEDTPQGDPIYRSEPWGPGNVHFDARHRRR